MQIVITGGSGLVGQRLTQLLKEKDHTVFHLSRKAGSKGADQTFIWDVRKQVFPTEALQGTDAMIHLAGAGVADQRWTERRKQEIMESRTLSTELIASQLQKVEHTIKTFVSASAIGIYGNTGAKWVTEEAKPADDFLAEVCVEWEKRTEAVKAQGIRTTLLRIGVVLSEKGGALPQIAAPVKLFVGAPLGDGSQYLSWIHLDDLCEMFIFALENEQLQGAFNAVAPDPQTNKAFTKLIGKVLHRPVLPFHVPNFGMKLALGEMAEVVLSGSRVSCKKIREAGFVFQFNDPEDAIRNLLG